MHKLQEGWYIFSELLANHEPLFCKFSFPCFEKLKTGTVTIFTMLTDLSDHLVNRSYIVFDTRSIFMQLCGSLRYNGFAVSYGWRRCCGSEDGGAGDGRKTARALSRDAIGSDTATVLSRDAATVLSRYAVRAPSRELMLLPGRV